jgi:hypothetical protein
MRWLMDQLAERCIAESLRLREDEDRLCERLDNAHEIIYSAWYSVAPEYARWRLNSEEEISPQEKERIEKAQHILWTRHNPKRAFTEGTRSEHYTSFHKERLHSTIASYLSRPYLRHPVLDWILLDMTISRELSAFGESLKETWLPGKRDPVLGIHGRYFKAEGNLAEMMKVDWNEVFERWNMWFWWPLAFPIAAIWASFHWDYTALGLWIAGIYAFVVIAFVGIKFSRFVGRLIPRLAGKADPRTRVFSLWDQMYDVWKRLEGPVVNPPVTDAARKRTAVHEAGHAVIGRVLGLRCREATIVPDDAKGLVGRAVIKDQCVSIAEWEARGRHRYHSIMRARVMAIMAGREAEIEIFGDCGGGDSNDQCEIAFHLDEVAPETVGSEDDLVRFHDRLRAKTAGRVRRHRNLIELVADALLKSGTLSAKKIDTLIKPYIPLPAAVCLEKVTITQKRLAAYAWAHKCPVSDGSLIVHPYKPEWNDDES